MPRAGSTGRWPASAPGTSSSRVPAGWDSRRQPGARHVRHRGQGAAARRQDGLRRRLPAADPPDRQGAPQGPQQHRDRGPGRRRLAVGDRQRRGRPRRDPPRPRHDRRLRRLRRRRARRARPRGRARPGAAVRARPPVGHRAPGVVHRAARRHHRLRREPAEEVPGHLPAQLRQRPGRHLRRGAAGRAVLDVRTGVKIFRVDNPHTKPPNFWALADRRGQGRRPRRAVPGRGVHPARADARAGQARLHAVLHLLHLAHGKWELDRVRRELSEHADYVAAEPLRQHARHPPREPAARRPGHVRDPRGAGRHDVPDLGRLLRASSCSSTVPVAPGSEEYLDSEKYELRPRDFGAAAGRR